MGRWILGAVCLLVVLGGITGCAPSFQQSQSSAQPQAPAQRQVSAIPVQSLHGSGTVYLLPLGNFPDTSAQDLVAYFKGKYGVSIHLLPHLAIPATVINSSRHQAVAESLIGLMDTQAPQLPGGAGTATDNSILIALTSVDMYSRDKREWSFVFSKYDDTDAVISSARMDPSNFDQPPNPLLLQQRIRKMVSKCLGLLYYRLHESSDPRSVLFGPIGGLRDLDAMGEEF